MGSGAESNFLDSALIYMLNPTISAEKSIWVKSSDGAVRTSQNSYILSLKTVDGEIGKTPFRSNSNLGTQGQIILYLFKHL